GQALDISMTDCSFALNAVSAPSYLVQGINPEPESERLNGGTFYGYYETKDGRYFSVGSLEPKFRKLLCEGIGQQELFDLSMSEREEDIKLFKNKIKEAFLNKTFEEWQTIFC